MDLPTPGPRMLRRMAGNVQRDIDAVERSLDRLRERQALYEDMADAESSVRKAWWRNHPGEL